METVVRSMAQGCRPGWLQASLVARAPRAGGCCTNHGQSGRIGFWLEPLIPPWGDVGGSWRSDTMQMCAVCNEAHPDGNEHWQLLAHCAQSARLALAEPHAAFAASLSSLHATVLRNQLTTSAAGTQHV